MLLKNIAAVLTICLLSTSGAAFADDYYAAIAGSRSVQRLGTANDQPSPEAARDVALQDCALDDCLIAASVKNGCVAAAYSLYSSDGYAWTGFGTDKNRAGAEYLARQICEKDAHGQCQIVASLCTAGIAN